MYIMNKLLVGTLILIFFGLGVFVGSQLGFRKIVENGIGGASSGGGGGGGLISEVAINCGSVANSTSADGREWVGESALQEFVSGDSRSSVSAGTSFPGAAPDDVPYKTSRISGSKFKYTFAVIPGQKIIRLHFYPASYHGFEKSIDYFSVKAGPFTLLRDYSASIAARTFGVNYIVKEFCLNVDEEHQELTITFSPSLIEKPKKGKTYAFVNGIEIISIPTGLYYTPEHELGVRIVGLRNRFYLIDNSTALELIHRLNIGGNSINSIEDLGMYRQWNEDSSYLLEPRARQVRNLVLPVKSKTIQAFLAPSKIYHTSWKIDTDVSQMDHNFTWKVPIELGFLYLVRLHFCELDYRMADGEAREFSVIINNQIAEKNADIFRWSGDVGIPVFRDYVVLMDRDREASKSDLIICLQSIDELAFGLLNGMEIFKLSDPESNLAAPDAVFPKGFSTSWNLKSEYSYLAFGQSNDIGTAMTLLIMLFSIIIYNLRKISEENCHDGKSAESTTAELSCHCFSLAEIKLATQNFSEAFVIGKGGFGKVYKGFLPGVPDMVAIKRLNFYSKQGAREFWTEIETLTKLRHIQLVSLIGYCNESMEMILVYEHISGGTLAENLYKFARKGKDCPHLSWEQRLKICIGAARGLEYLHTSSAYGVIHRDIKDTNILLDENFVAKISDFGLSRLEEISESKSYVSTKVKGTVGYLDPDYFTSQRLTRKTDVYSFGIVMLVVLSGKPALDAQNLTEPSLLSCFQECVANDDLSRIVDPRLQGEISSRSLRDFVKIVENCLHQLPKRRPTMAQVVSSLEQALENHQSHMSSSLLYSRVEDENMHSFHLHTPKTKSLERSVISPESPPAEENSRKLTQNLAPMTRGEDLHQRGKETTRLRKSLLAWPWKAVWNRDSTKRGPLKSGRKDESKLPSAQEVEHFRHNVAANPLTVFTLEELRAISNGFRPDQRLGAGGFGSVFKGFLSEDVKRGLQPMPVAIKRHDGNHSFQGHREWLAEVIFLGQLSHPNLVKLIGYCCEDEHRLLVYEYMAGGSVENDLFSRALHPLSWSIRMKIAFDAAKGLQYLHELDRPVIFRDFKTSNILLDLDYNAKLSDFGLAKDGPIGEQTHVSTRIMGTYGYAAPEYVATGRLTSKSDIYSYGVVLLELLTGKRSLNKNRKPREQNLVTWVMPLLRDKKKLLGIVDPKLEGDYPIKDVHKVAVLAHNCLNPDPKARPSMRDIVDSLEPLQERNYVGNEKPTLPAE